MNQTLFIKKEPLPSCCIYKDMMVPMTSYFLIMKGEKYVNHNDQMLYN